MTVRKVCSAELPEHAADAQADVLVALDCRVAALLAVTVRVGWCGDRCWFCCSDDVRPDVTQVSLV